MNHFSPDLCMKYADFKINWHLVSESKSDGSSIREYEADAPIRSLKYYKRVTENASFCKTFFTIACS